MGRYAILRKLFGIEVNAIHHPEMPVQRLLGMDSGQSAGGRQAW